MALRGRNRAGRRRAAKRQAREPVDRVVQPCPLAATQPATTLEEKKAQLDQRNLLVQASEARAGHADITGTPKARQLQEATQRLRDNNKMVERARLADDVYDRDPKRDPELPDSAPVGWKRLKNFSSKKDRKHSFHAALYESQIDGSKVLVFEGTSDWRDWKGANIPQGMGLETYQFNRAMDIAREEKNIQGPELELAGHSLGGGLASAGAGVAELETYTFNAAGLHPKTVKREGGSLETAARHTRSRYIKGELLTTGQKSGDFVLKGLAFAGLNAFLGPIVGAIGAAALPKVPQAVGTLDDLAPVLKGDPLAKHGMEHVIVAIEAEKQTDLQTLKYCLS